MGIFNSHIHGKVLIVFHEYLWPILFINLIFIVFEPLTNYEMPQVFTCTHLLTKLFSPDIITDMRSGKSSTSFLVFMRPGCHW